MIEGISLSTNQLLMLSFSSTGDPNALVRGPAYALELNSLCGEGRGTTTISAKHDLRAAQPSSAIPATAAPRLPLRYRPTRRRRMPDLYSAGMDDGSMQAVNLTNVCSLQ